MPTAFSGRKKINRSFLNPKKERGKTGQAAEAEYISGIQVFFFFKNGKGPVAKAAAAGKIVLVVPTAQKGLEGDEIRNWKRYRDHLGKKIVFSWGWDIEIKCNWETMWSKKYETLCPSSPPPEKRFFHTYKRKKTYILERERLELSRLFSFLFPQKT